MDALDLAGLLVLEIGDDTLSIAGGGAAAAAGFCAMVAEVMDRPNLSKKDRDEFEVYAKSFIHNFGQIMRIDRDEARASAFQALLSAQYVGIYYAGGSPALARIKGEIEKARMEKAHAGRSRPDITDIVERQSRELWKVRPSLKSKISRTAGAIFKTAFKEISALPDIPKQWKIDPKKEFNDERSRLIDAIRKRIPKDSQLDK